MIPEIGHYALIVALSLALVQTTVPLIGSIYNNRNCMRIARSTALGQFIFIAIAFFSLGYAFISNDFSVAYVAENSNTHLPFIYRFCAIWGAHSGSLLLWVMILSIWVVAVTLFSRNLPLKLIARVLSVLGFISFGFLLFLLLASNPFVRWLPNFPANGLDLNPLLQDPGLVIHPPMLYMGYVGFSVVFAFAIAALISREFNATWAHWLRPWTLAAWCFLTWGITLGSWWSYRELGWGGWWAWDPVENASFLPWLVGSALIHSLIVVEKRGAFKSWTVLLAIFAFSLSLIGTFLVRSGVLISVHTFALDPKRGVYLLIFIGLVIALSLLLYASHGQWFKKGEVFDLWSRETMLLANNVLLIIAMLTVLIGTLYPLTISALGLGRISVGAPYFNTVFIPIMLPLVFIMGMGPFFYWKKTELSVIVKKLWPIALLAIILAFLFVWLVRNSIDIGVSLGLALAFWLMFCTLQELWQKKKYRSLKHWAMNIAHFGLAICMVGIVLNAAYSVENTVKMTPNTQITVGRYRFQFLGIRDIQGSNYKGVEGGVAVFSNQYKIALLKPQLWTFLKRKETLSKVDIDVSFLRDIYVALAEPLGKDAWAIRIYIKPFVRWIWVGGILMFLGGLLAIVKNLFLPQKD